MKRKIFLIVLTMAILACVLALSAYATDVDYEEKATLADGTVLPIYDKDNNPLIWYVSGLDEAGNNIYASVPNNRNSANRNNDVYVTYSINTSWKTQLENINFHVWNDKTGKFDVFTEESYQVVVVNLRGISEFEYINKGLKVSDIQYVYFNEILKDFCEYFKGSTSLRLVDLSVCTNLSGGFGGNRNLYNCINLHTVRLAPGSEYTLICSVNNNWRFSSTAINEIVIPANITSVGIDNFKNCASLESVYILGDTTSLGQRNFLGCSKLTNIYILGEEPQIDVSSFRDNFYECVDGNTTYDFTSIGKYFFFVSSNYEYLNQVKEAIGATSIITYADYISNPASYTEGRYIISDTSICDVYYGVHDIDEGTASVCAGVCNVCGHTVVNHAETENISVDIEYASLLSSGIKITKCNNDGCTYNVREETKAMFACLGYSAYENGTAGIVVAFVVNREAVLEYAEITGKSLKYGVFAALKEKLGDGDIFTDNAVPASNAISVEISNGELSLFELKIVGITPEQKDKKLAIGAYATITDQTNTEHHYLQADSPIAGEKYSFVSYNDIIVNLAK